MTGTPSHLADTPTFFGAKAAGRDANFSDGGPAYAAFGASAGWKEPAFLLLSDTLDDRYLALAHRAG